MQLVNSERETDNACFAISDINQFRLEHKLACHFLNGYNFQPVSLVVVAAV